MEGGVWIAVMLVVHCGGGKVLVFGGSGGGLGGCRGRGGGKGGGVSEGSGTYWRVC